jgi:hypothetical protein
MGNLGIKLNQEYNKITFRTIETIRRFSPLLSYMFGFRLKVSSNRKTKVTTVHMKYNNPNRICRIIKCQIPHQISPELIKTKQSEMGLQPQHDLSTGKCIFNIHIHLISLAMFNLYTNTTES